MGRLDATRIRCVLRAAGNSACGIALLGAALAACGGGSPPSPGDVIRSMPLAPSVDVGAGAPETGAVVLVYAPDYASVADSQEREAIQADPEHLLRIVRVLALRLADRGITDATVRSRASGAIEVAIGGTAPERLRGVTRLLAARGRLVFRLVAEAPMRDGIGNLATPDGHAWLPMFHAAEGDGRKLVQMQDDYGVGGEDLDTIEVAPGALGDFNVSFRVRDSGVVRMERLTGENIGHELAIVLDDRILSAPTIRGQISRHGTIEGGGANGFSQTEAEERVALLKAGHLPVALTLQSQSNR